MRHSASSEIGVIESAIRAIFFLACAALPAAAQTNCVPGPACIVIDSAAGSTQAAEEIIREVDDPATGDRWLLKRNSQYPARPGRMVLVARQKSSQPPASAPMESADKGFETGKTAEVIHAGDHLVVEEHTRRLDAVLEAIALAPAREGGSLRVRLSVGRRVVMAVAVASGRALLSPASGAQP